MFPFPAYHSHMQDSDTMLCSRLVIETENVRCHHGTFDRMVVSKNAHLSVSILLLRLEPTCYTSLF